MYSLESGMSYYMCTTPVDMRKGIDSLYHLAVSESCVSPMDGGVFVFFSSNRKCVKMLRWIDGSFLLYHRKLSRGTFEVPVRDPSTGYCQLPWKTFSLIMEGVSVQEVRLRPR